jgi:hypothetical protein
MIYLGMDVHKDFLTVAAPASGAKAPERLD